MSKSELMRYGLIYYGKPFITNSTSRRKLQICVQCSVYCGRTLFEGIPLLLLSDQNDLYYSLEFERSP